MFLPSRLLKYGLFALTLLGPLLASATPPLQGQLWRANYGRTGEFLHAGPASQPSVLWKLDTGNKVASSPVVVDGVVYIGSDSGSFYAIDARSGAIVWEFKAGAPVRGSAAVLDERVFVTASNAFFALDRATGAELWRYTRGLWADSPLVIDGPIATADGRVLEGIVWQQIPWSGFVGRDVATGQEVWRFRDQHGPGSRGCSAALHRGKLIWFRGSQATVLADVLTERMAFEIDGGIDNGYFTPAARDGVVYSYIEGIVAFDIETNLALGKQTHADWVFQWRFSKYGQDDAWDFRHPGISSLSVDERAVYFGHRDGLVYALNRTDGSVLWTARTGAPNRSSPALDPQQRLYLGSHNGKIYGIDRRDGRILWEHPTDGEVHSSPALYQGTLFVGSDDGFIYALR